MVVLTSLRQSTNESLARVDGIDRSIQSDLRNLRRDRHTAVDVGRKGDAAMFTMPPRRRRTGRNTGEICPRDLVSGPDQSPVSGGIGLFPAGQSVAACVSLKDPFRG
jgi:hypothetical protein